MRKSSAHSGQRAHRWPNVVFCQVGKNRIRLYLCEPKIVESQNTECGSFLKLVRSLSLSLSPSRSLSRSLALSHIYIHIQNTYIISPRGTPTRTRTKSMHHWGTWGSLFHVSKPARLGISMPSTRQRVKRAIL